MSETEKEKPTRSRLPRNERRKQILQALVQMIAEENGDKLTTARIAEAVGLSEGGLYRSFKSKSEMFDSLLDFIEDAVLGLFKQIREDSTKTELVKVHTMIRVLLDFSALNPGLTAVLTGRALIFEDPMLMKRLRLLLDRLEVAIKQTLREATLSGELPTDFNLSARSSIIMSFVMGKWSKFVISNYKERPNTLPISQYEIFLGV